jgi:hypothetical protein
MIDSSAWVLGWADLWVDTLTTPSVGESLRLDVAAYILIPLYRRSAFIFQVREMLTALTDANIKQIPVLAISYGLVIWKVNIPLPEAVQNQTIRARLRRIESVITITTTQLPKPDKCS